MADSFARQTILIGEMATMLRLKTASRTMPKPLYGYYLKAVVIRTRFIAHAKTKSLNVTNNFQLNSMKPYFTIFCFILCAISAIAQNNLYQNTFGGSAEDLFSAMVSTPEGGVLLGGYSDSSPSGDRYTANRGATDIWLIRLNAQGDTLWQRTIGGDAQDELAAIKRTSDGGFVLAITSNSGATAEKTENSLDPNWFSGATVDYWIVKIDALGAIQWQNTLGGEDMDIVSSITETVSGDLLLGGSSSSNAAFDKTENNRGADGDMWVLLLNGLNGNVLWDKTIGGNADDQLISIAQTADGGYILGGFSTSNISSEKTENSRGGYDYWLLKLDAAHTIIWQKTYGGSGVDYLKTIQQTTDGGYIVGGVSNSPISGDKTTASVGNDYWILKLDAQGAIQWQRTIGGNGSDKLSGLTLLSDGNYLLTGSSNSSISGDKTEASRGGLDYWVVKLNTTGTTILYQKTLGGNADDELKAVAVVAGNYWLGGNSLSAISGDKTEGSQGFNDYWVLRLWANGAMFPGDAYNDFNANHYDLLPIGAAFNEIGVPRANNSILWQAQPAMDWAANTLPINRKYIDSNGDGTINAADTTAILRNYGHTHNGSDSLSRPVFTAANLVAIPISLTAIDTLLSNNSRILTTNVLLGTPTQPAQNVYGVAFSVHYNPTLAHPDSVIRVVYQTGWFGATNEVLQLVHDDRTNGILDISFTRTTHTGVSGNGLIAKINVVIDNINGKGLAYRAFILDTTDVLPPRLVDSVLNSIPITSHLTKTVYIEYSAAVGTTPTKNLLNFSIFPNPLGKNRLLQIQSNEPFSTILSIVNSLGQVVYEQVVYEQTVSTNTPISLANLPPGVYALSILSEYGRVSQKIVLE
ncbi:MAG: hypothetical protein RI894_862 [Bacteroidota bacterium]